MVGGHAPRSIVHAGASEQALDAWRGAADSRILAVAIAW
jgi:hypothetical protein